jgi:DNA mismatch repair ATPase MutS
LPKNTEKTDDAQLGLDIFEENEIVSEIKALDLDSMSPMEALTKLYALKAKAKFM